MGGQAVKVNERTLLLKGGLSWQDDFIFERLALAQELQNGVRLAGGESPIGLYFNQH